MDAIISSLTKDLWDGAKPGDKRISGVWPNTGKWRYSIMHDCGKIVDECDNFCRHCGGKLERTRADR
jgi:hypothetical protein